MERRHEDGKSKRDAIFIASTGTSSSDPVGSTHALDVSGPSSEAHTAGTQSRYEHFEILRREDGSLWRLGSGAMGTTYKAFDTRLQYAVALKVIRADLLGQNPVARARFLREARMAASVRHPNIASVFHLGELPGDQCFYAMEFVEGETLAERVQRHGPQPILLALEIALQVTRALMAAGRCDLIHRDIKPANLMLTAAAGSAETFANVTDPLGHEGSDSADRPPLVKLIDFGLARTVLASDAMSLTSAGDFVGTPAFASPEQLGGDDDPIDGRSDIFSLGSTLWYLLTGKQPFAGRSLDEIRRLQQRARPVQQLQQAAVPEPVIRLLRAMLAADPTHRPQTPTALAEMLVGCRRDLLLTSCTPRAGAPRVEAKSAQRGMLLPAVVAAIVGVLTLGWIGWCLHDARVRSFFMNGADGLPTAPLAIPERSIAVLPFVSLSDNPANAYFADGVQDEILTDLAKVAVLKVISRTSVVQYKSTEPRNLREIADQLGVANVLEGSVQRVGNTVRVTAQLIDARTDTHLWAEHYDRPLDDVFGIQSDIAQAIARELQARLSPQEKVAMSTRPTADFQAYDLYLRARALYADTSNKVSPGDKLPQAVRVLDEALARDPKFLAAWCLLARAHCSLYFWGFDHTPARLEKARAAVDAALSLQPDAGEAHLARAIYFYFGFRDYTHARAELDLARRALPNEAEVFAYTGYIARREGRWTESTRDVERALELDPRNFFTLQQLATTYELLHRYPDAIRIYDRALTVVPGDPVTRILRAELEIDARADVRPFQTTLAALLTENPNIGPEVDDTRAALCERTSAAAARFLAHAPGGGVMDASIMYPHAYWEGVVARWEGDGPRARAAFSAARPEVARIVANQPDFVAANSLLGLIDAGLGRKDAALAEGRRACELLPLANDAIDGPLVAANLAQILAWTGDKTAAIDLLTQIEQSPNPLSYGMLKLHPIWDDLHGDPRFEKLVTHVAGLSALP